MLAKTSSHTEEGGAMRRGWREIHAHNRETEALAERLERRIHVIALVITATVLTMRLLTGRTDLVSSESYETAADPAADVSAVLAQ